MKGGHADVKNEDPKTTAPPSRRKAEQTPGEVLTDVLGEDGWAALRAWVRQEIHLEANGASHEEREALNP